MTLEELAGRFDGAKKTFATPDDMKGVKIRVPGTPLYEGVFKSFGAVPTPLALTDVYSALQQGLVTAYEQPLPGIQAEKWYESANQITLSTLAIEDLREASRAPLRFSRFTGRLTVFVVLLCFDMKCPACGGPCLPTRANAGYG